MKSQLDPRELRSLIRYAIRGEETRVSLELGLDEDTDDVGPAGRAERVGRRVDDRRGLPGVPRTRENREKVSAALRGRIVWPQVPKVLRGRDGKVMPLEHRMNLKAAAQRFYLTPEGLERKKAHARTQIGRPKKCGHCGELGHNRRGCPELVDVDDVRMKAGKVVEGRKQNRCSVCGEYGHKRPRCPRVQREVKEEPGGAAAAAAAAGAQPGHKGPPVAASVAPAEALRSASRRRSRALLSRDPTPPPPRERGGGGPPGPYGPPFEGDAGRAARAAREEGGGAQSSTSDSDSDSDSDQDA
ncbi:unnamed protein product [Pedinophyceae sp. YPF-701]|nr:unnamed protein product [Pedinophyceae sp. YPF-701]